MEIHDQLQLAQATQKAQSYQIVELLKELNDCYTTFQNLNASIDNSRMWIKMSKDHFSVILKFLETKEILRIRLVSRKFNITINQCFPILAITQQQKCQQISQQIEILKAQPTIDMNDPFIVQARNNVNILDKRDINELKCLAHPPNLVLWVMSIVYNIIMGKPTKITEQYGGWKEYQQVLNNPSQFLETLQTLDIMNLNQYQLKWVEKIQEYDQFSVKGQSKAAASLHAFVQGIFFFLPCLGSQAQLKKLDAKLKSAEKYFQLFQKH